MNVADEFAPWLGVFETLRVVDGVPLFVTEHRAELASAMAALGLTTETDFRQLAEKLQPLNGRWRWIVTPDKTIAIFNEEKISPEAPVEISVSPVRVGSQNWDARFKTLSYLSHAQASKMSPTSDAVMLNENGHVASASRGNIFWRRGEQVFTPAHEAGCRCGVVRGFVLAHLKVKIGHFPLHDLLEADEIFMTNSIKGIVSVNKIEGRPVYLSNSAAAVRDAYDEAVAVQIKRATS